MNYSQVKKAVVVGGCGHVGLPLAIALAHSGLPTISLDIDQEKVDLVNSGILPFIEEGCSPILRNSLDQECFSATTNPEVVSQANYVIVVIGTPVDSYLNPNPDGIIAALNEIKHFLNEKQILILRSTLFPGVTKRVEDWASRNVPGLLVSFCPERIAEGKAMTELYSLPQIIGARDQKSYEMSEEVFSILTPTLIRTTPEEAELAKLFTNVWRYIKFATVNQFYMLANDYEVDFENVRKAITTDYPRAQDMPGAGFAAGPCLFKDTMQLGAFSNNTFALGHSAMLVNEGLPLYLVERISRKYDLSELTVGILGMAFKPEIDDPRSSLSYKLKKILQFKAKEVICADPYVKDPKLVDQSFLLDKSDLIIIATPHQQYGAIAFKVPVIDIWNLLNNGIRI